MIIKTKIRRISAIILTLLICLIFAAGTVQAKDTGLKTYVPGYGDIDFESLGITDEMIEQYSEQAGSIDLSDPAAAEAQIKEMAAQSGYEISDSEAGTIREVLEDAQSKGLDAGEMKGVYKAVSGADELLKGSNDFLGAIKSFFVNIFEVIKSWFMGLFHLG